MSKHVLVSSAAAAVAFIVGTSAQAATIMQLTSYQPEPVSAGIPEFAFIGGVFTAGPGASGNGDGDSLPSAQTAPGLTFLSPFTIPGAIPGKVANGDGTTTFYDCTFVLPGLVASGPAVPTPILGLGTHLLQPLGAGPFSVLSTDPAGPDGPVVLLTGFVDNAAISGLAGTTAGVTFSATVTYTGGPLWTASGYAPSGDFSWSLVGITPPLAIGGGGILSSFETNATGLFDAVVPEPTAALAGLALGAMLSLRRRS